MPTLKILLFAAKNLSKHISQIFILKLKQYQLILKEKNNNFLTKWYIFHYILYLLEFLNIAHHIHTNC